jgi:hypothetical protein
MSKIAPKKPNRVLKAIARGLSAVVAAGAPLSSARAFASDYRSPQEAPVAWRDYAWIIKGRLQEWLAQDEERMRQFRASFDAHSRLNGAAPAILAQIWVAKDGKIERVISDELKTPRSVQLSAILVGRNIGAKPPLDMVQPLNLRLSFPDKN